MNRVASARSRSTFLLVVVALLAVSIWTALRRVPQKATARPVEVDTSGQVLRHARDWLTRETLSDDSQQLADVLNQIVTAQPDLIAIRIIQYAESGDPSAGKTNKEHQLIVAPDDVAWEEARETDHQVDSRLVLSDSRPIGRVDFYYRGKSLLLPRRGLRTASEYDLNVWPLLLVLTISVLFCIAQWGRSLKKMQATQDIPKRVRHSIDMLSEGLLVMDKNEKIILTNLAFQKMTGLRPDQLIGKTVSSLAWDCSETTRRSDLPWIRARDESHVQIEQLMRFQKPDGSYRFFSINSSPVESPDDELRDVLSTFRDVTDSEQHRAQTEHMLAMLKSSRDEVRLKNRELQILATQDAMTGCLNRRAFFEQLEVLWDDVVANGGALACLMFDCDHFKNVNDQYGHQTGDDVLINVANILVNVFTEPALVCRYGGEEFCVVVNDHWIGSVVEQANAVREKVRELKLEEHPELSLSVSIGISELASGATSHQELISQADECLYGAKRGGRDTVVLFSDLIASDDRDLDLADQGVNVAYQEHEQQVISSEVVKALVSALAYRDYETADHSRRVADLCIQLSDGLLSGQDIHLLEVAALLHDIGKIGIPDDILLKPDRLSDEEWASMLQYERIGLELISNTFSCDELFEILRSYRADYRPRQLDSGFPVGTDIPLAARLLKLADAYDAMTTEQRYCPARSVDEAIQELQACSGEQFAPVLVEHLVHFLTVQDRNGNDDASLPAELPSKAIGIQVEKIADAIDARDVDEVRELAASLAHAARQHDSEEIAFVADRLRAEVRQEQFEWVDLLRDTESLLNLCRADKIETISEPKNYMGKDES